jgi:hypothetical protein
MRRASRAVLALLIVLSLAVPAAVAPTAADGDDGDQDDAPDYSLEFLASNGEVIHEEFTSVREADGGAYFWLVRYPPSGLNSYGGSDKEYLKPDSTVRRNQVRVFADEGTGNDNTTFRVVYWTRAKKKVTTNNSTTTEEYAKIEAVENVSVDLEDGFQPSADISLRGHYDNASMVTVWKEGNDEVKWVFKHKSVATAAPVNINGQSDLQRYIMFWIFLPAVVSVTGGQKLGGWLRRTAGAGPSRRGLLIGGGLFVALGFWVAGYVALASLIVTLPLTWAFALAWISFAYALDEDSVVEEVGLLKGDLETVASPLDNDSDIVDAIEGQLESKEVVEMPNGDLAVYEDGFGPFYARLKGAYTKLNIRSQESEMDLSPSSDYDRLVWIDADRETVIDHTPERVIIAWPWKTYQPPEDEEDLDGEAMQKMAALPEELRAEHYIQTLGVAGALAGAAWISMRHLDTWIWGVGAVAPLLVGYFATAVRGYASTRVAPGQARSAWMTAFYLDLLVKQFSSIRELAQRVMELESKDVDIREELREMRDDSLIERASKRDADPFGSDLVEDDPARAGGDD